MSVQHAHDENGYHAGKDGVEYDVFHFLLVHELVSTNRAVSFCKTELSRCRKLLSVGLSGMIKIQICPSLRPTHLRQVSEMARPKEGPI